MQKPKNLQDIFDRAGSSTKLAAALNIHAYTAENWRRCGIPQKYWDKLKLLYGLSPDDIFNVNKTCKQPSK